MARGNIGNANRRIVDAQLIVGLRHAKRRTGDGVRGAHVARLRGGYTSRKFVGSTRERIALTAGL